MKTNGSLYACGNTTIIDEILDNVNGDDQDFKDNLNFVFQQIGKTFLKKNFQLEKKLNIDWRFDDKDMFINVFWWMGSSNSDVGFFEESGGFLHGVERNQKNTN